MFSVMSIARNKESIDFGDSSLVKRFFEGHQGHCLKAWIRFFDTNHDGKIEFDEFVVGMQNMNFQGDVMSVWYDLDQDNSGEITLNEICEDSAFLWVDFKQWCAMNFESGEDIICRVGDGQKILYQQFVEMLPRQGWKGKYEAILFTCMDADDSGVIEIEDLKWLDAAKKIQRRKDRAKAQVAKEKAMKLKQTQVRYSALKDYKDFLIKRHGCLFRAWRKELDKDGSMTVQQRELFKACRETGWEGDVRALWKALDSDDSGVTSLEELDANLAWDLGQYKAFLDSTFGDAEAAFTALEKTGRKKLRKEEFINGSIRHRCQFDRQRLAKVYGLLDWEGKRYVTPMSFAFLDSWKPAIWLMSPGPNIVAAEELKTALLRRYKTILQAWQFAIDRDGSNRVGWQELLYAARKIGYNGDLAGAWLTYDADRSGYISYEEMDPHGFELLKEFKSWAEGEFGGVTPAFRVLDDDGSGALSFLEFKTATRSYGFQGHAKKLFRLLDCDGTGSLSVNEISFLEEWVFWDAEDLLGMGHKDEEPTTPEEDPFKLQKSPSLKITNVKIGNVAAVASWYRLKRKAQAPKYIVPPGASAEQSTMMAILSQGPREKMDSRQLAWTPEKTRNNEWPQLLSLSTKAPLPIGRWIKEKTRHSLSCVTPTPRSPERPTSRLTSRPSPSRSSSPTRGPRSPSRLR